MACGLENEGVDESKFSVQISLLSEHSFSSRSLGERRLVFQRCLLWNPTQENFSKCVKQSKSLVLQNTSESHEWSDWGVSLIIPPHSLKEGVKVE